MMRLGSRSVLNGVGHSMRLRMKRQIARSLVLTLTVPSGIAATAQNANLPEAHSLPTAPSPAPSMDLRAISGLGAGPRFEARLVPVANSQAPTQDTQSQQSQTQGQKPVGTAAAPYEKPTGVAGSRPAGAAIAPGKQKHVHSIVIRVAVIAAAGVAIGTAVGLSHASSSRP
jgi:hypothetical protein